MRDSVNLRAGERWDQGLLGMITEADIFQLFWSWNSSQSPYVEHEWRHAFSLRREMFIRPTYWEDPWPDPPEPLRPIHFQRIDVGTASASAASRSDTTAMTVTLLDLLRMRSVLCVPEVVRLLNFLAPLADHAIGHQLGQIDFTLSGIHLTFRGLTGSWSRAELLQRPLTAWEHLELKVDAVNFSFSSSPSDTWTSPATRTPDAPIDGPRDSYVRLLSLLAYELLGGPRARLEHTGQYTPVARLNRDGNAVLRRGIVDGWPLQTNSQDSCRPRLSSRDQQHLPLRALSASTPNLFPRRFLNRFVRLRRRGLSMSPLRTGGPGSVGSYF